MNQRTYGLSRLTRLSRSTWERKWAFDLERASPDVHVRFRVTVRASVRVKVRVSVRLRVKG